MFFCGDPSITRAAASLDDLATIPLVYDPRVNQTRFSALEARFSGDLLSLHTPSTTISTSQGHKFRKTICSLENKIYVITLCGCVKAPIVPPFKTFVFLCKSDILSHKKIIRQIAIARKIELNATGHGRFEHHRSLAVFSLPLTFLDYRYRLRICFSYGILVDLNVLYSIINAR